MRTFFLIIALLAGVFSPRQGNAIPFHDCNTDPANLEQAVHEEHGGACGNTTEEGVPTNSDCTAGCSGNCPLGEWTVTQDCFDFAGTFTACALEGNIVCGISRTPKTYSIDCEGPGAFPAVEADRDHVSCEGVGGTVTCDCSTSSSAWAANCQ